MSNPVHRALTAIFGPPKRGVRGPADDSRPEVKQRVADFQPAQRQLPLRTRKAIHRKLGGNTEPRSRSKR